MAHICTVWNKKRIKFNDNITATLTDIRNYTQIEQRFIDLTTYVFPSLKIMTKKVNKLTRKS